MRTALHGYFPSKRTFVLVKTVCSLVRTSSNRQGRLPFFSLMNSSCKICRGPVFPPYVFGCEADELLGPSTISRVPAMHAMAFVENRHAIRWHPPLFCPSSASPPARRSKSSLFPRRPGSRARPRPCPFCLPPLRPVPRRFLDSLLVFPEPATFGRSGSLYIP